MFNTQEFMKEVNTIVAEAENRNNSEQQPINTTNPDRFNPRKILANLLRVGGTILGAAGGFMTMHLLNMQYSQLVYPIVVVGGLVGLELGDFLAKKFIPNSTV